MSSTYFRVEMGKALHGDCLFVEWSDGARPYRMLIDGGPIGAWDTLQGRIAALPEGRREFELMVLSHVDADHIEGLVRLLAEPPAQWPFSVKDVWFNGWHHLDESVLGPLQGEFFSALLMHRLPPGAWNRAFGNEGVVVPPDGPLPVVPLAGGMTLTLLSPTRPKLDAMRKAWQRDLRRTGIAPGDIDAAWQELSARKRYLPDEGLLSTSKAEIAEVLQRQFRPDRAAANGASIAFLAEHPAGSCLFLADAHPDAVTASLTRLLAHRGLARLKVDAVKVAHHGSKNNTDATLAGLIDSPRWLFSSSGALFKHPDEESIARILEAAQGRPVELCFNYLTDFNRAWAEPGRQARHRFTATFAAEDEPALVLQWPS